MCDSLGVFLELLQYSAFQDQWLNTGGRTNAGLHEENCPYMMNYHYN